MKLEKIPGGYALYKEKTIIGTCQARPTEQGADITALTIVPEWRRKGYGSYLLKEVLRSLGGYDKEMATVFTAPLPADAGELAFWAKFGFAAEGSGLCRRRTPDLTAVKLVQDFLAARLTDPGLCIDATCGNGGDTAFSAALWVKGAGCWALTSSRKPLPPPGRTLHGRALRQSFTATATPTSYNMCSPAPLMP